MPISVECPRCHVKLKAPDRLAGQKAKCKCGNVVAVPGPDAQPAAAAGPASVAATSDDAATAPRWRPMTARVCPNCQEKMQPDAVLCGECGFHTVKGIVLPLTNKTGATGPTSGRAAKRKRDPFEVLTVDAPKGRGGLVVGLAIFAILGGGAGWWFTRPRPDPVVAAANSLASKIVVGMALEDVVAVVGRPVEAYAHVPNGDAKPGGTPALSRVAFTDNFVQVQGRDRLSHGFYLVFRLAPGLAHEVHFGADARVSRIEQRIIGGPPSGS